jgi:hypothetical protein
MKASDREDAWLVFKILTEPTPAVDFLLKSCYFGVGRKHFKHGFKVWLVYLLDLCSLVWHSESNIFEYVKTKQVKVFILMFVFFFH